MRYVKLNLAAKLSQLSSESEFMNEFISEFMNEFISEFMNEFISEFMREFMNEFMSLKLVTRTCLSREVSGTVLPTLSLLFLSKEFVCG